MEVLVLVFGVGLLAAVLTSALASRSPLSTSTVFLVTGLVAGPLGLDLISVEGRQVEHAAELALFAVLFTDGQHAPWPVVRRSWREPTRALVIAMPLSLLVVAALGHWVAGLDWLPALVLGAVLAPTDPVFASALVGRDDVPEGVRHSLNIESGLNDGLALPAVLVLCGLAGGDPESWSTEPGTLLLEVLTGILIGLVVPAVIAVVLQAPKIGADPRLRPLGPIAVALLIYGASSALHANPFLAAFIGGAAVATLRPEASESFRHTGELVSELTKGAALLAFATLVDAEALGGAGWSGFLLAVGVVLVARPLPLLLSVLGSRLRTRERLAAAWFGPKGFASVAYAVIVAFSDMESADRVLALVLVTVLLSVVAHSSTDVVVARWLTRQAPEEPDGTDGADGASTARETGGRPA